VGGAGATLVWNSTANFLTTGQTLFLGSGGAYNVNLTNPIDLNGANRTIQVNSGQGQLNGALIGGALGALTKAGAGTLTLTVNDATFSGGITVNAGTLTINGNAGGNNAISLTAGSTLSLQSAAYVRELSGSTTLTTGTNTWSLLIALQDATLAGTFSGGSSNPTFYGPGAQTFTAIGIGVQTPRSTLNLYSGGVVYAGTSKFNFNDTLACMSITAAP
jgi:autotransporter-associated beta strand protein